jgi:hypothetical protein
MKTPLLSSRFLFEATNQLWSRFLHEATGKMTLILPQRITKISTISRTPFWAFVLFVAKKTFEIVSLTQPFGWRSRGSVRK